MIDENKHEREPTPNTSNLILPLIPVLPTITKSQINKTPSLEEITNKMLSETASLVSFLSILHERIQTHLSLTEESINDLFHCLDFIPRTNFFYPLEALKKITEMLSKLMKAVELSIIDSSIKRTIFEKGYRINDTLIDYRLKEKYLVAFYSAESSRNLSEAFCSDMRKLSKGNNCNISAVNQLQLIFDNVNCKMSGKNRNDIGNQLYDLRVMARTNFRKFSYQQDINHKRMELPFKQPGKNIVPIGQSNVTANSNSNNISNAKVMTISNSKVSNDIEIIQLFSQEELNRKEKESFSYKHRYNNQVSRRDNDNMIDNMNMFEGGVDNDKGYQQVNANSNNNKNKQEGDNNNQSELHEVITQIPLSQSLIKNNNDNQHELNDITLNNSINKQTAMQCLTESNKEDDSPAKKAPITLPQRAQSEEKTTIIHDSYSNNNQTKQSTFKNQQPKSNNNNYNRSSPNDNHKNNQNNNNKNQNLITPINPVAIQMASLYQNLMSMINQQQPQQQQNRNYFQHQQQLQQQQQQIANQHNNNHITTTTITPEQLKSEYLSLKSIEKDNPAVIKANLFKYEQFIILPLYLQINRFINQKKQVYSDIYNKYKPIILTVLAKNQLEKSIVQPFGSIVNNFLLDEGDVDICIVPDNCSIENFSVHLNEINEIITMKHLGTCLLSHISPRYSLLKISDKDTGMTVDITVQSMLPLYNTKLIRSYSLYDQRFHIIGIYVKYWFKRNKINGATEKYLSSYALIIMIIHFLQMEIKPSVLPVLQRISNENKPYDYTHSEKVLISNVYYEEDMTKIKEYMDIVNCGNENKESVACLLLRFFEFYAYGYDHNYMISISNSEKILANTNDHVAFPIDDPFDEEHNPGKSMKLNTSQYDNFILCMKREINHIMRGEIFSNDFLLGY